MPSYYNYYILPLFSELTDSSYIKEPSNTNVDRSFIEVLLKKVHIKVRMLKVYMCRHRGYWCHHWGNKRRIVLMIVAAAIFFTVINLLFGSNLSPDLCFSHPCLNGGACTAFRNRYSCDCLNGYSGTNCENYNAATQSCSSTPCRNGGTCVPSGMGYTCSCRTGYTGTHCDQNVIRNFLTNMLNKAYENKASMIPPIWDNGFDVHVAQIFTDIILMTSTKEDRRDHPAQIEKTGKAISLTKLLSIIKSINSCRVLITGKAGMGKTTLLKYIAYNWATYSSDTFADKLLFLVNVRDIKAGNSVLDVIVQQYIDMEDFYAETELQRGSKIIQTFLRKHDDELVFLLDGLDELEAGSKGPENLFNNLELRDSTVILTSRPDRTDSFLKMCDVHVKVMGFSVSQMKQFIHKYFNYFNESKSGESLINVLRIDSINKNDWGGNHKEAFELCSSPLLLLHICTIWNQNKYLPNDLTDLYKEVFLCILNQNIGRRNDEEKVTFDSIPKKYSSAILALGGTMYKGLQKNILHIDKTSLTKVYKKDIVDLALKLGFVYKNQPVAVNDHSKIYSPSHKLLSEALAGFYLSTKCRQMSLHHDEYEKIRSSKYLHMTRVFAIGFLGKNAGKLMKHWLMNNATNYYSLATYFKYVKTENQITVIQALDDHMPPEMKKDVEIMTKSLKTVLNINKSLPAYSNEHLVQLMTAFVNRYTTNPDMVMKEIISIIDKSSQQESERICMTVAHISLLLQMHKAVWHYSYLYFNYCNDMYLFKTIEKWGDEAIMIFSTVWNKHYLKDEIHILSVKTSNIREVSIPTFCKIIKMFPKLNYLEVTYEEYSDMYVESMVNTCTDHQKYFIGFMASDFLANGFKSVIIQFSESYSPFVLYLPWKKTVYYSSIILANAV
ncbi:uncharacterized protein LOC117107621 [Anneissia japonica]|uniref:uncharacterized protein LOC117107621 n=1 Tax=Anneissia japonica TaxID=1529436 RepID=UPI0014256476|nr:uncharacterized protein LOC117107621 [Anneissia japonica]